MPLRVVLGLEADATCWPRTTDGTSAEAGGRVTGPRGLVGLLETSLGLRVPAVSAARRLACWRRKLALADGPGRFWHDSLAADAMATARLLLGWRDSLVEAGWTAGRLRAPPPRLADLAAAEEAGPALPAGPADRLRVVLSTLRDDRPPEPPVAQLRLLDRRGALPPHLRDLLDALEAAGTEVTEEPSTDATAARGDLGTAQGMLILPGSAAEAQGDGSLVLLTAASEGAAAELVADFLAAERHEDTVILAARPTGLLDAALRRRHLPRIGRRAPSSQRGVLQLLPLMLSTLWKPFDAARLLDLTQVSSPIPREVRSRLRRLLEERPGRGGSAWAEALMAGLQEARARIEASDRKPTVRVRLAEEAAEAVRLWLEPAPADPDAGIPLGVLRGLCGSLAAWAAARAKDMPLMAELCARARALDEALAEAATDPVPRGELERLLEAVQEEGVEPPDAGAEAAPWGDATSPDGVWGRPGTLVWWGFDAVPVPPRLPWDAEEADALRDAGCLPALPGATLSARMAAARRPILAARRRALLVTIGTEGRHPVADEIAGLLPAVTVSAEALLMEPAPRLCGSALPRRAAVPLAVPKGREEITVGAAVDVAREEDSATALEELLGCPLAWVLRHRAGLRAGALARLREADPIAGGVAHLLAQRIFAPGRAAMPTPPAAESEAHQMLPALLEEAGAPLLQPGMAREHATLLAQLPRAMRRLAGEIIRQGLHVAALEEELREDDLLGPGQSLAGRLDMRLVDAHGQRVVLDLKWTRRPDRYRDRVGRGEAIQLAAYARLAGAGERAAYVTLPSGTLLSPDGTAGAPTLAETWDNVVRSRAARAAGLATGRLLARGLREDDPDAPPLAPEPPCRWCDKGRLCGKEALA